MEHLQKYIDIAVEAAVKAGVEILNIYGENFEVSYKEDTSPLTLADQNANARIMSYLVKTGFPIISEENKQINYTERKSWENCWIVDPLDGTKEFIKRNGEFTVNIAFINRQKPIFGVIYVPVTKTLYVGNVSTKKSFKATLNDDLQVPHDFFTKQYEIKPKSKSDKNIQVVGSRSHMNTDTKEFIDKLEKKYEHVEIVSKGSSLKLCLLAEGKADVYPRFAPTMEWDTAAGQAICNAVGIKVLQKDTDKELIYNKENLLNPFFIASAII